MLRNIAIIAHVDHGKTTLVDQMLRQAGTFRANQQVAERVMDSNPLERERGITILSKNASIRWGNHKINLVDTPGHADFGGEVERILRMVDGVLLLVDAFEGPMPQTRFVTRKALALGLQPVVVINKVDRPDSDPARVHDEVLELFMELEATDRQLDAPFIYASARDGWAVRDLEDARNDLHALLDTILEAVPAPPADRDGPFQLLVSTIDHSPYLGRLAIGRIERGSVAVGDSIVLLDPVPEQGGEEFTEEEFTETAHAHVRDGARSGKVAKLFTFEGLERVEAESAGAGEVVALAGLEGVDIGSTIADPEHPEPLRGIAVEEPTVSVDFMVNNSPFAGREGKYVTSRQLRERLMKELERNVALRVEETASPDTFTVSGRGELHLGILMETMRREGYEFAVSRPRVITRQDDQDRTLEPYEEVLVDVPQDFVGVVIEGLGKRKGEMLEMRGGHGNLTRLVFKIPARGLFGYRGDFLTETRGEGIMHHRFLEWGPWAGEIRRRDRGVLVSMVEGVSVGYALFNLQERSTLFIGPGVQVYEGMIVGENARAGDLEVNVAKGKKLTNIRAAGADEAILLETPRRMSLEEALEFIDDDELVEMTPESIRLRKRHLKAHERKKAARASA